MGAMDHDVIATALLSVLCFVLVMVMLAVYLVLRWRYHTHKFTALNPVMEVNFTSVGPPPVFHHLALRKPGCWLAIKNRDTLAVQNALALHNPKPCSWVDGLSDESEQRLFVSPPIAGWIFVLGSALPDPIEDVDGCFRFLLDLSRKVGHVQFFQTNPVVNHHAWAQAETGRIVRGYAWGGKTFWNQGAITTAEKDLGMRCYEYGDASEVPLFSSSDPTTGSNADKVHLLAARWSIDPEEVDERFIEQKWGIVGEPSRFF